MGRTRKELKNAARVTRYPFFKDEYEILKIADNIIVAVQNQFYRNVLEFKHMLVILVPPHFWLVHSASSLHLLWRQHCHSTKSKTNNFENGLALYF